MEYLIMVDIFSTFLLELEIFCQDISKNKSTNQMNFFFLLIEEYILRRNSLIKNSNGVKIFLKLNSFRKKKIRKRI